MADMFTRLGIFGPQPARHVENSDARLEIRRDESQSANRKKDREGEGEYTPVPWEDVAYVSIASLKAFFLGALHVEPQTPAPTPVHEASNEVNRRAAAAYQSVGRAVHDSNIQTPQPPADSTGVESHFSEADLARVRGFVADLLELETRGVTELAMQRSANFLDSVEEAITAAKSA